MDRGSIYESAWPLIIVRNGVRLCSSFISIFILSSSAIFELFIIEEILYGFNFIIKFRVFAY